MMNYKELKHKLIPDVVRQKYYDYLRFLEYKKMKSMPEEKYEDYLCDRYKEMMNRSERTAGLTMDFENPKTYSQKQQWMKLYGVSDDMRLCSDKYAVRSYISDKIGESYLIPLLSIDGIDHFSSPKEIDFDKLPESFVLKCNHGSHYNIIVKNKSVLSSCEIRKIKRKLDYWLNEKYEFKVGLELYYRGIKPYIIIEKYMEIDEDLPDYKFYCFKGEVKFLLCMQGRYTNLRQTCFNPDYTKACFSIPTGSKIDYPDVTLSKPKNYNTMLSIAKSLSAPFEHVRVDLYNINGEVFFGELTFCNASGFDVAHPIEYDEIIGEWISIDQSARLNNYRFRRKTSSVAGFETINTDDRGGNLDYEYFEQKNKMGGGT